MLIPLQDSIVYGPILSRRLGRSLGVNLFPFDRKVCSFDCIYCHFGRAEVASCRFPVSSCSEVLAEIERFLRSEHEFDCITLSGNGEPTMYPDFAELIPKLKELVRQYRPGVKLVLLSNSTTLEQPGMIESICQIDVPIMKLDAADPETFAALNQPCSGIRVEDIIAGLTQLARRCPITLQSAMVDGVVCNSEGKALDSWIAAVGKIRPASVQIYTTDRPVADGRIRKVPGKRLEEIAGLVSKLTGVEARAFCQ